MKRFLLIVLIFITIQSVNFGQSPVIQNIINQTNLDSLTHFVRELSGEVSTIIGGSPYTIVSRNKNNASNNMAANYIKQKLDSYGLVTYDQWWSGAEEMFMVCSLAHNIQIKIYYLCAL